MNESEESLYSQLDRLEQSLDSELNELQAFLQNSQAQEISNEAQESIDIETDDCLCKNNEFFKTESGYNQTCIVKTTTAIEYHGETASRQAFYRCGKHCYQGEVTLDLQHAFDTTLDDIPVILHLLQQQQSGFLSFQCDSENDLSEANGFYGPLHELEKAQNFLISEVSSDGLSADIEKLDDKWQLYFELVGDTSCLFQDVLFACSRVHSKGLTFIHLYFEGVLYAAIQDHDLGEQPLLDVMFSAYFRGGNEGSTLAMYNNTTWMKLSAWKRAQRRDAKVCLQHFPKPESEQEPNSNAQDLVSDGYVQSYYILKPDNQGKEREVMFRFGAWLYSGRVDLPSTNSLQEIPCVIREMRLAQHKLEFVGDTSSLPASNKFIKPMLYSTHITKCMEEEAASCEVYLRQIMTEAQVDADQEDKHWLELDENKCFFEFACGNDASSPASETLKSVELVCNKVYNANNVITISIYHAGTWYLVLEETGGENPLLDSKFPDLSSKRNGCQLKTYPRGQKSWTELRSLSVWQAEMPPVSRGEIEIVSIGSTVPGTANSKHGYLRSMLPRSPLRRKNR
jgi:hypothetical protein